MKKVFNILSIFIFCFILVGCGKNELNEEEKALKSKNERSTEAIAKAAEVEYLITKFNKKEPITDATLLKTSTNVLSGTIKYIENEDKTFYVEVENLTFDKKFVCEYKNQKATCNKK